VVTAGGANGNTCPGGAQKAFGFALVDGVPSSIEAVEETVTRLAPPMDTWFGMQPAAKMPYKAVICL
jgi:hypothetical protein